MILDSLGVLEAAGTTIAATGASTNYIDLGVTKPQPGVGVNRPWLCIRTAVAPTVATDTLSIAVQCHDDTSFGAGTPTTTEDYAKTWMVFCGTTGSELHADVDSRLKTAGAWIYRGPLPMECDQRYIRLYYTCTASDGVFDIEAWLSPGPPPSDFGVQVVNSNVGNP